MAYLGKVPADVLIDPMVDSAAITDATIVTADLANDAVTSAKLAADSVDSSELVNGSVDNAHLAGSIAMNKTNLTAGTGLTLSTDTLSVDAAQTQITSVGTIGTGVWNGTAIASAYLDADTAHLSGTQTFSGAKTFTGDSKFTGQSNFQIMGDSNAIFISSSNSYDPASDTGHLYIGGFQSGNTNDLGLRLDYDDTKFDIFGLELRTNSIIDVDSTTKSTSKTTGAVQIAGGVGIAKTLNVGEDVVAYASSDERYKDLITPIQNPNEKIKLRRTIYN